VYFLKAEELDTSKPENLFKKETSKQYSLEGPDLCSKEIVEFSIS
jgi:hypothetical protein